MENKYNTDTHGCIDVIRHRDPSQYTAVTKISRETNSRPTLGFRFTEEEEARMERSKAAAASFMSRYGKGRDPYMIDITHYDITGLTYDTRTKD